MNTWGMSAEEILDGVQAGLVEWLPASGGVRVDIESEALGHYGETENVLTMVDGTAKRIRLPREAQLSVPKLRRDG